MHYASVGDVFTVTDMTVSGDATFARARNIIIHKNKPDVFEGNPNTLEVINRLSPNAIVVYGVASDVCVDAAVMGLLKTDCIIGIVKDAIKGLGIIPDEKLYKKWIDAGAILTTTKIVTNMGKDKKE